MTRTNQKCQNKDWKERKAVGKFSKQFKIKDFYVTIELTHDVHFDDFVDGDWACHLALVEACIIKNTFYW
jgi:hypothetical protein